MKINENDKKSSWQIHLLGDHAILFSLKEIIDTAINAEVHAFNYLFNQKISMHSKTSFQLIIV